MVGILLVITFPRFRQSLVQTPPAWAPTTYPDSKHKIVVFPEIMSHPPLHQSSIALSPFRDRRIAVYGIVGVSASTLSLTSQPAPMKINLETPTTLETIQLSDSLLRT